MSKSNYQPISVEVAKQLAEQHGKDWVVILAFDRANCLTHTTTYGASAQDKVDAAIFGEVATKAIDCEVSLGVSYEDFRTDFDAGIMAMLKEACESGLSALECQKAADDGYTVHDRAIKRLREAITAANANKNKKPS